MDTLFILPDNNNEQILFCETSNCLPSYFEQVGENTAFDSPQIYNDYFGEITGIPVYRRYTFNTQKYVVFVFEQINDCVSPTNGFGWMTYDSFAAANSNEEIKQIVKSVWRFYNTSANMPWVNKDGFTPYFKWLHAVCEANDIRINGKITQVKNAYVSNVFCVPTSTGNMYMKTPGKIYITELPFTHELRKLDIVDLPKWIDFDLDMNVVLMSDMGGNDLPSDSDTDTFKEVILRYAKIQKDSIAHIPLDFTHYDNSVATILDKLRTFPAKSYEILKGTSYELSKVELDILAEQVQTAISLYKSMSHIPSTIHGGDVRPGNIRVVDGNYIFYDWAWGAIAHPFVEIVSFLHIVRRSLPDEHASEMLIDAYLQEWLDHGSFSDLKHAFSVLATLKDLFFAIVDYDWLEAIVQSCGNSIDYMSADGWLLDRRSYYFANVLRRFIATQL